MADVYAKTSIYYDAEWGLRVLRETFDGTNAANDTVVNQPCLPSAYQSNLYEIRFTPLSGNTGNITRNDAPGFVPMGLVRRLDHELRKTAADADGTYNSTVSIQVDIRKISNPVDAVSGVINLTNSVTKQTSEGGPMNPYYYMFEYLGADSDTGYCTVNMEITAGNPHNLRIYAIIRGPQTGGNNETHQLELVPWIAAGVTLSQYRITTTLVSATDEAGVTNNQYTLNYTSGATAAAGLIAASTVTGGGTGGINLTYRIRITRISDNAVMYDKYYRLNARTRN